MNLDLLASYQGCYIQARWPDISGSVQLFRSSNEFGFRKNCKVRVRMSSIQKLSKHFEPGVLCAIEHGCSLCSRPRWKKTARLFVPRFYWLWFFLKILSAMCFTSAKELGCSSARRASLFSGSILKDKKLSSSRSSDSVFWVCANSQQYTSTNR